MTEEKLPAGVEMVRVGVPPWRWVSTHNPFYLLSALFVLWGIWSSVLPDLAVEHVAVLWGITLFYTLLVAASTVIVIRVARVWEDARTLLLIVPVFCLLPSMLFDEFLLASPSAGLVFLTVSYGFGVVCFESVLRLAGLRPHGSARWCYYLLEGVLYVYPVILWTCGRVWKNESATVLALSLYPFVVSGVLFLLLPFVSATRQRAAASGTPYLFPWFPYSLFGLLLLVAGCRLYLLALAFAPGWNYSPVEANDFIPFVLTAAVLVLELSHAAKWSLGKQLALGIGLGGVLLAHVSGRAGATSDEVLGLTREVTCVLVALLATWAWHRQTRWADGFVVAMLFLLAWRMEGWGQVMVMGMGIALLLGVGLWRRSAGRLVMACGLAGVFGAYQGDGFDEPLRFVVALSAASLFVILLHALTRGDWLDDWRDLAIGGLLGGFGFHVLIPLLPADGWRYLLEHGLALAAFLLGYGWWHGHAGAMKGGAGVLSCVVLLKAMPLWEALRLTFLRRGVVPLGVGLLLLMAGLVLTLRKGGIFRKGSVEAMVGRRK